MHRAASFLGSLAAPMAVLVIVGSAPIASADEVVPYTSYEIFRDDGWQEQTYPHPTIMSASHCFLRGEDTPYTVQFSPGARDTVAPWGTWDVGSWATAFAFSAPYTPSDDLDVAFGLVCAYGEDVIGPWVGSSLGIAFNSDPEAHYTSFGYPATDSLTDLGRQWLNHTVFGGEADLGRGPDSTVIGAGPDVAVGGSSGSPVVKKFSGQVGGPRDKATGVIVAEPTEGDDEIIYSAYLGDEAYSAYEAIQSETPC